MRGLYRYVFRGLGALMLIGMMTVLILAISRQLTISRQGNCPERESRALKSPAATPAGRR